MLTSWRAILNNFIHFLVNANTIENKRNYKLLQTTTSFFSHCNFSNKNKQQQNLTNNCKNHKMNTINTVFKSLIAIKIYYF